MNPLRGVLRSVPPLLNDPSRPPAVGLLIAHQNRMHVVQRFNTILVELPPRQPLSSSSRTPAGTVDPPSAVLGLLRWSGEPGRRGKGKFTRSSGYSMGTHNCDSPILYWNVIVSN